MLTRHWPKLVLGCAILLAGCYPEYNWRVIPVADGQMVAAFPGKVHSQSRALDLAGVELEFHVESARLESRIFALGYARLPAQVTPEQRRAVMTAMTDSLYRSLGATVAQEALEGRPFVIRSEQGTTPLVVVGRVLAHRDLVVRMMASGPIDDMPEAVGMEFIESLSLR